MDIMKEFECKGCGTVVYLPPKNKKEPICPQCRGVMREIGEGVKVSELKKYECPACKNVFFMKKDYSPYKCPFCNYTFPVTPRLKQEEKL